MSSVALWYTACLTSKSIIDAQYFLALTVMLVQVAMPVPTAQPVFINLKQAFGREGGMLLSAGLHTALHNLEEHFNAARPVRHPDACTMAGQGRLLLCLNLAQVQGLANKDLAWLLRVPFTQNSVWNRIYPCSDVMHMHNVACLAYADGQTGPSGVAGHGYAHVSWGCGRRLAAFKWKYSWPDVPLR